MGVAIEQPGYDIRRGQIDDFGILWNLYVFTDALDLVTFNEDQNIFLNRRFFGIDKFSGLDDCHL
jgi:hypothetical protein